MIFSFLWSPFSPSRILKNRDAYPLSGLCGISPGFPLVRGLAPFISRGLHEEKDKFKEHLVDRSILILGATTWDQGYPFSTRLLTSTSCQHGFPLRLPSLLSETMPSYLGPWNILRYLRDLNSECRVEDVDMWALSCRKSSLKHVCKGSGVCKNCRQGERDKQELKEDWINSDVAN